jgi:ATP phosphoribosyltransferase regulatory subunit HisZ
MTVQNTTTEKPKPITFVLDRLYNTVLLLIKGSDSIQDRLLNAFQSFNSLKLDDFPKDFPEELQKEFEEIQNELIKVKALRDEGKVKASLRILPDERANDSAKKLLNLLIKTTERWENVPLNFSIDEYRFFSLYFSISIAINIPI